MKWQLFVPSVALLSWGTVPVALAQPETDTSTTELNQVDASTSQQSASSFVGVETETSPTQQPISVIPRLSELEHPHTSAELLVEEPTSSEQVWSKPVGDEEDKGDKEDKEDKGDK